jgi:hypothetical protein
VFLEFCINFEVSERRLPLVFFVFLWQGPPNNKNE